MSHQASIDQVLAQMRQLRQAAGMDRKAELLPPGFGASQPVDRPGFGNVMKDALTKVNELQKTSDAMKTEYIRTDGATDITRVMVASQKASIAFQATVQVRNKMVEAYKEIMNMPV
ncbi:Flagellar hook-basal body complex protein [gamma proteobacterium HdN1]|nr:Flagellar hook-basal body complex protein [gamma proteobacterium HdN1]